MLESSWPQSHSAVGLVAPSPFVASVQQVWPAGLQGVVPTCSEETGILVCEEMLALLFTSKCKQRCDCAVSFGTRYFERHATLLFNKEVLRDNSNTNREEDLTCAAD